MEKHDTNMIQTGFGGLCFQFTPIASPVMEKIHRKKVRLDNQGEVAELRSSPKRLVKGRRMHGETEECHGLRETLPHLDPKTIWHLQC